MKKIRAAVVGYGNIGRFTVQALNASPDFEIAGVVRRSLDNTPAELASCKVVTDIRELGHVDVFIVDRDAYLRRVADDCNQECRSLEF